MGLDSSGSNGFIVVVPAGLDTTAYSIVPVGPGTPNCELCLWQRLHTALHTETGMVRTAGLKAIDLRPLIYLSPTQ